MDFAFFKKKLHSCLFDKEAEEWLIKLKNEAVKVPCAWVSDLSVKPKWYDHSRFKKGEKLCCENLFSMFFSHLCGLYLLVYIPSILYPLLSTGKSRTTYCIFLRYRSTLIHVNKWYMGDVWDPASEAYNSLLQVRNMHKTVADRLNLNKIEGKDSFAISQYDMCLTQFAFCGLVILFPNYFGFFPKSDEDIKCVLHFWRCIGYLLGIKDEYNFCDENNLTKVKSNFNLILEKEMKHSLIHKWRRESKLMSDSIIESIKAFIPTLTVYGFKKYLFKLLLVTLEENERSTNWIDILNYYLIKFYFKYGLSFPLMPSLSNNLLKLAINKSNVNEKKICALLSTRQVTFETVEKNLTI